MASSNSYTGGGNVFEDLSGNPGFHSDNPYDSLIEACQNESNQIQSRYQTHRTTRNTQQKAKLLSPDFSGFNIDHVLHKLVNKSQYPEYEDQRNCLVFWARPPQRLKALINMTQQQLLDVAPNLWLMPLDRLHMTALEITHSVTSDKILALVSTLRPKIPEITDYTYSHRSRLIKPMLSYDTAAIALSFLPAAGEELTGGRTVEEDGYTYHHLRRDLYETCSSTGVKVASRYTVPSAHLTIARFVTQDDIMKGGAQGTIESAKIKKLVEKLEEINAWLEKEYWPSESQSIKEGGEWVVGEEKGFDCRKGTLWYGGGETVRLGKGF